MGFTDWWYGTVPAKDSKDAIEKVYKLVKAYNQTPWTKKYSLPYAEKVLKTVVDGMSAAEKIKGLKADLKVLAEYQNALRDAMNTQPYPSSEELAAMYKVLLKIAAKYMKSLPPPASTYAYAVNGAADSIEGVTSMLMHTRNLDPELRTMYENFLAGRQF